jgi:pyrimidine-specific ribonucleoside hydrolase/ribosylpyrimidine nucleosidase
MNKTLVWIDCDPGIDDCVALAIASASQDLLDIRGISAVSGNLGNKIVTENALRIASYFGMNQIPVVSGAKSPLLRKVENAASIHGKSGLGNYELPETDKQLTSDNALLYIRNVLLELPENQKMVLVPIGPLTNIALLIKTFPEVIKKIEKLVLMGGSLSGGNVTKEAEFNIWADPEAAKIVFDSELSIVMCGLDVTGKCGLTREHVQILHTSESPKQKALGEMLQFYFDTFMYRDSTLVNIHDAVALLYLTNPLLFKGNKEYIDVDCTHGLKRGKTFVCSEDTENLTKKKVLVLNEVDLEAFQKIFMDILKKL